MLWLSVSGSSPHPHWLRYRRRSLVPSREENQSYLDLLAEIQREVGRISGRFGAPGRMPLEFMHRSVDDGFLSREQFANLEVGADPASLFETLHRLAQRASGPDDYARV